MNIPQNIETVYCLKDDTFEVEEISNYVLSIVLGNTNVHISVYNSIIKKVIAFELYQFEKSYPSYLPSLESVFSNHIYLQAGYWKDINIVFSHSNFAFITSNKFKESEIVDYLSRNNAIIGANDYSLTNELSGLGLYEVFVADKNIIQFFDNLYPEKELKIKHHLAGFMYGVISLNETNLKNHKANLYILIDELYISIVMVNNNSELMYSNMFFYTSLSDMVYYVLFTLDIFKLNQKDVFIMAWSSITNDSEHFNTLSKFLVNFQKGDRLKTLNYTFLIDEIENHRFFETFSLNLN